jgi:Phasin protein
MAQNDSITERSRKSPPMGTEVAALGKKQIEDFVATQTQLFQKLRESNKHWFDRVQTEATLACELTAKLTAARSIPEVATAYQEWASRHMQMAAEDAKRILDDGQKLAETGARFLSNGWSPNGHGGST